MVQLAALRAHDRFERADLVQHVGIDILGIALHLGAAEILAVRIAGMGSDRDSVFESKLGGRTHRRFVTRVKSACDIGRRDKTHELGVVAAALAHVAIKIDLMHFVSAIYTRPEDNSIRVQTARLAVRHRRSLRARSSRRR